MMVCSKCGKAKANCSMQTADICLDCSTPSYVRPKTRGELRDKINEGIACEVAAYVSEMTSTMLIGWLKCSAFTVRPSHNSGWVVYELDTSDKEAGVETT